MGNTIDLIEQDYRDLDDRERASRSGGMAPRPPHSATTTEWGAPGSLLRKPMWARLTHSQSDTTSIRRLGLKLGQAHLDLDLRRRPLRSVSPPASPPSVEAGRSSRQTHTTVPAIPPTKQRRNSTSALPLVCAASSLSPGVLIMAGSRNLEEGEVGRRPVPRPTPIFSMHVNSTPVPIFRGLRYYIHKTVPPTMFAWLRSLLIVCAVTLS